MGFHGRAAASPMKCIAKHRIQCYKARCHWTLEQWRRVLWSDESHSLSGYFKEESGFGCQENRTCLNAMCQV